LQLLLRFRWLLHRRRSKGRKCINKSKRLPAQRAASTANLAMARWASEQAKSEQASPARRLNQTNPERALNRKGRTLVNGSRLASLE
jgi:hypothetical protein